MKFDVVTLKRVVRVFIATFVASYGGANLIAALGGSAVFDYSALRAAAVSGLVAVAVLFWNAVLDPSPVPSLEAERKA